MVDWFIAPSLFVVISGPAACHPAAEVPLVEYHTSK
jgi:hypothetical protein